MRYSFFEVLEHNDKVIGVLLKPSFCAEQEWGIETLQNRLGIDSSKLGLDGRTTGDTIQACSAKNYFYLGGVVEGVKGIKAMYDFNKNAPVGALWDSNGAAAALNRDASAKDKEAMLLIHECIKGKKPLVVMLSGGNGPFQRSGLLICPADLVPDTAASSIMLADIARDELAAAWAPVKQMLEAHRPRDLQTEYLTWAKTIASLWAPRQMDCSAMYLGPRGFDQVDGSKYPFKLWLNPNDQQICDAGWYTVEEILQWYAGHGPVFERSRGYALWRVVNAIKSGGIAYPPDYNAVCKKCLHIHYDGNASGKAEMTSGLNQYHWAARDVTVIDKCPNCGASIDDMVFSTDNPEHYKNKKEV